MIARRALIALLGTAPLPLAAEPVLSDVQLSDAQVLLFETPHLAALQPPLRLDYAFLREEAGRPPVEDVIRLVVQAGAEPGAARRGAGIPHRPTRHPLPTGAGFPR